MDCGGNSMFRLSSIFRDPHEEYLIIPAIRDFFRREGIKYTASWDKEKMLSIIEEYAKSDQKAEECTLEWLDNILLEGIKEIQIEYRNLKNETELLFDSKDRISSHLDTYLTPGIKRHICGNNYLNDQYQFVRYKLEDGNHGIVARMYFCKKMHFAENKSGVLTVKAVDYPIIAEYYFEQSWLCLRYKARTGLYHFKESGYDASSVRISTAAQVNEIVKRVENILGLEVLSKDQTSHQIREKLFILLDRYTHTLQEILNAMEI